MKTEQLAQMSPTERRRDRLRVARRFLIGGGVASVVGNLSDTAMTGAPEAHGWWAVLSVFVSAVVSISVPLAFIFLVDYVIKLESVEVRNMTWHRVAVALTALLAAVTFTVSFTKLWNLLTHIPGESHIWWLTLALAAVPDLLMTAATLFMHTLSEPPKRRARVKVEESGETQWLGVNELTRRFFKGSPEKPVPASPPPSPPSLPEPPVVSKPVSPKPVEVGVQVTDEHLDLAAVVVERGVTAKPVGDVAKLLALRDAGHRSEDLAATAGMSRNTASKLLKEADRVQRSRSLAAVK
jgi:hypothetical protein